MFNIQQVLQVSCIGEFIQVDEGYIRIAIHHSSEQVRANKTGTSCYDYFFIYCDFLCKKLRI